jgi:cell fate (sporulation/competence/biofilm development) regulator YlbF (YheA/YmcA/DUF963 family)
MFAQNEDEDPELAAAIAASLELMALEESKRDVKEEAKQAEPNK